MSNPTKRTRPPRIDLSRAHKSPAIRVDTDTDDAELEDTLQLSDSDDSDDDRQPTLAVPALPDDINQELAALQQLRQNVKKNLQLRPIRSRGNLPKVDINTDINSVIRSPYPPQSALTPQSTTSSYFTPISDTPRDPVFSPSAVPTPPVPKQDPPCSIDPYTLYNKLLSNKRPLLIDTRPLAAHQAFHLRHSINIAIPSLILKRCRRPGGGLQTLDAVRQFVTTERSKAQWDALVVPGGPWDGDVVVVDDDMNPDNTAWSIIPVIRPLLSYGSVDYLEGGISTAGHHPQLETLIVTGDEEEPQAGLFQLDTLAAFKSKPLPEIEPSSSTSSNPPSPPPRSPLPMMPSSTSGRSANLNNVSDATPSPPPSSIGFRRPAPPRRPSAPNLRKIDTKSTERLPKLSVRTKPMRSATLAVPPTLSLSINPPQSPSHLTLLHSNHHPTSPSNDPSNFLTPYYTPPHTPGTPKPGSTHHNGNHHHHLNLPPSPQTARPDLDPPTTDDAFPVFTISTILPNFLFLGPELTLQEHVDKLKELGVKRILNIAAECDDDAGLGLRKVFDKYHKIPMRDTVEEENIARGVREVCELLDDARLHSAPTYVHCKAGKSRSVTAVMAYLIHANHWTLSKAYSFVLERRKGISPNIGFVSELMNFEEQELGGKSVGVQPTSIPSGGLGSGSSFGSQNSGSTLGSSGGGEGGGGEAGSGATHPDGMYNTISRRAAHVRDSLPPALGLGMDNLNLGLSGAPGGSGANAVPMSAVERGVMNGILGDAGQEMEVKDASGRYRHARRAPVDENTLQPMRRVSKAGLESMNYA